MTDAQFFQLLQTIVTLATMWFAYKAKQQSLANSTTIEEVRKQTNHIKDELVATTRAAANAEGNLEGRAELRAEQRSP